MARLLLLLVLWFAPARAQTPLPVCSEPREGMTHCFAEVQCRCRWQPGGSLDARFPGYRWDCGTLRPRCGVVPPGPAPADVPAYLPPGYGPPGYGPQGRWPNETIPR